MSAWAGLKRHMLRGVLVIGVALLAAVGCGGEETAVQAPDCVAPLTWSGVEYWGAATLEEAAAVGTRLGKGIIRCRGESAPPGRHVDVLGIEAVSSSVAVAVEGEPYAWLAPGYLPESLRHPLHDAVFGSPEGPNAEAGFRCGSSRTIRARALTTPVFDIVPLEVAAADEEAQEFLHLEGVGGIVTLDADTVVTGFEREGIPFVQAGDEFWLVLSECEGKETEPGLAGLRRLVVRKLEP
jgi:hypothetical protein